MHQILIVEDDADIAESLQYSFRREGFLAVVAESGEQGFKLAIDEKSAPSLIILDLMLPGMSGLELCRRFRREPLTEKTPIIMVTARTSEVDKIAGLESGADDFVVKPFSVKEVVARARALLRRKPGKSFEIYEDDCIHIDVGAMRVACGDKNIKLTRKEFLLLVHMVKNIGRVPTRQQLLDHVWGYNYYGDGRTLDVHIRRLRQKLGACAGCIETVVGVGYRFLPQDKSDLNRNDDI